MQFFGFHLMPWPYMSKEWVESGASSWVTVSNANYDPVKGHELYARYLDELVEYERVGFDGICVNEHHQTSYGNIPSPNVMAALLVPRTTCKIAILGNAISLRDHPLRVAEEVALLDVVSGGRIISGFVRGIGSEYHAFSLDPTQSRDRFYEAHDLIVKAWTEPGPFEWYGEHFKLRYVNPWPRPLQQPHPPVWSPSLGSNETIDWAAREPLHLPPDLHRHEHAPPRLRRAQGDDAEVRLRGAAGADRLVAPDLRRRHRRAGRRGGAAAPRAPLQRRPAHAEAALLPRRLPDAAGDGADHGLQVRASSRAG